MTIKTPLTDYRVDNDKIWGIFRGVVEDRKDPELLCRCRVRVFGIHDELKVKDPIDGIPTEELPWAEPCYGLFEGSVSGNGNWCVPLQGSHVFVFFENGNWMQPRFFLTAPGFPIEKPNPELGFNDPLKEWPDEDWLEESDAHRLMKVDLLDFTSLLKVKVPEIDVGVPIALGGEWEEHTPMYQAQYPDNVVVNTHGGVYTEMDSTLGQERYHIYHPSNSYFEIGPTGNMVLRNNASRWDICVEYKHEHTMKSHHRTIDENRTSKVLLNEYEQIGENRYREIGIDDHQFILGSRYKTVTSMDFLKVGILRSVETGQMDQTYAKMMKTVYVGLINTDWYNLINEKYTAVMDREVVGVLKQKWVQGDETRKVDITRKSYVKDDDTLETDANFVFRATKDTLIESNEYFTNRSYKDQLFEAVDGEIVIRAGGKIVLESLTGIEFRGPVTDDLTDATNIGGILTWNGVALGTSTYSLNADAAVTALPGPPGTPSVPEAVPIAPPVPPMPPDPVVPPANPPMPVKPADPADPPALPPPTPPPIPPVLEYVDVPPDPDVC